MGGERERERKGEGKMSLLAAPAFSCLCGRERPRALIGRIIVNKFMSNIFAFDNKQMALHVAVYDKK